MTSESSLDRAKTRKIMIDDLILCGVSRSDAEPAVDVGMKAWDLAQAKIFEHTKLLSHEPIQEFFALVTAGYGAKMFGQKTSEESGKILLLNAIKDGNTDAIAFMTSHNEKENYNAD